MSPPHRSALFLLASLAGVAASAVTAGTASATNDQYWSQQWGPSKIGAPAAWAATTGAGVKIGIVDSGVDLAHQDLQGGKIVANASCIGTAGDSGRCVSGGGQDVVGHGTHVAGIAAATKDNGVGTAGIAPSAQLVVARVFQGDTAELDDVEAGIRWVVQQGARVVNLSLGENVILGGLLGGGGSLVPALNAAWASGAVPVVAAGNAQLLSGSASYGDVNAVIVGATGPNDELASYSVSTGSAKWAIVAPGGNGADAAQIISTYWRPGSANQYAYLQGTSMATPHVSGALALLLSRGLSQQRSVELLLASANRGVSCGATCAGRLDVAAALAASGASLTPGTTAATTPPPSAAATTAAPRPRRTVPPPAPIAAPAPTTTTAPPAPETTPAPAPPSTEVTQPPATPDLEVAAAAADDEDEVALPGAAAGLLLAGVAASSAVLRRRSI